MNKLDYEEIAADLGPVIGELTQAGFLQTGMLNRRKGEMKIGHEAVHFCRTMVPLVWCLGNNSYVHIVLFKQSFLIFGHSVFM